MNQPTDAPLTEWLEIQSAAIGRRRWRGVVWIADEPERALIKARRWLQARTWRAPLWVGPSEPDVPAVASITPARARSRLGSEHDLVVFDAASNEAGFDPDAFGAVSGTLCTGGWLLLLTPAAWRQPEKSRWYGDADYRRLAHWPYDAHALQARYLARLARRLNAFAGLASWPADVELPSVELAAPAAPGPSFISSDRDCLSEDQAMAVERLVRMRRRRPVVLVADRGRGKSAALGIAAARRLIQGERQLWISAASLQAVASLFTQLQTLIPEGRYEAGQFSVTLEGEVRSVTWLAPERVLSALEDRNIDPRSPPTLFVDEAAMIPAARLIAWLERFPRIAFATTVHGYEGTGRGFEVRLRDRLDQMTPDWRRVRLETPVRWAPGDPLERLTCDLLCLEADIDVAATLTQALEDEPLRWVWLERAQLARDEYRLQRAFGLLVQAHYRTAPSDLRQLLDGPDVRLLAAMAGDVLVGLCVMQQEGGFDAELAARIHCGERRPRGHLLAQSLAMHASHREAATARWWRIQRIAVHPTARLRGVGAGLIAGVAEAALGEGIDRLGVSFGAEAGLVAFWQRQGFASLRLGLQPEAASGEPALMMGKALRADAEAALAPMRDDFQTRLPDLLGHELVGFDSATAAALLQEGPPPTWEASLGTRLTWFADGGGELAAIRPWLRRAWLCWLRQQAPGSATEARDSLNGVVAADAAVAMLFQGQESALADTGRRDRQAAARALAQALLEWHARQ